MVPTLHINRRAAGVYEVTTSGPEMRESETFSTIAEGLKFVGDSMPREWAHFAEVRYGGLCLGTRPLKQLADSSEEVACELVALVAAVSEAETELEALARASKRT